MLKLEVSFADRSRIVHNIGTSPLEFVKFDLSKPRAGNGKQEYTTVLRDHFKNQFVLSRVHPDARFEVVFKKSPVFTKLKIKFFPRCINCGVNFKFWTTEEAFTKAGALEMEFEACNCEPRPLIDPTVEHQPEVENLQPAIEPDAFQQRQNNQYDSDSGTESEESSLEDDELEQDEIDMLEENQAIVEELDEEQRQAFNAEMDLLQAQIDEQEMAIAMQIEPANLEPFIEPLPEERINLTMLTCSICLSDMFARSVGVTPCGHQFHLYCLERTLAQRKQCPICNTYVEQAIKIFYN